LTEKLNSGGTGARAKLDTGPPANFMLAGSKHVRTSSGPAYLAANLDAPECPGRPETHRGAELNSQIAVNPRGVGRPGPGALSEVRDRSTRR